MFLKVLLKDLGLSKTTTEYSNSAFNLNNKSKWLYISILILIALGVGGYFVVKKYNTKKNTKE